MRIKIYGVFLAVLSILQFGCTSQDTAVGSYMSDKNYPAALLGENFFRTVACQGPERNPVVVIHGFLGARLRSTADNRNVWGEIAFGDAIRTQSDRQLRDIALPMEIGKKLTELSDDVVSDGLLTKFKVHFSSLEFDVDGYDRLIALLKDAGYQQEGMPLEKGAKHPSLFVFDYDWRRDIPENAVRLERFLNEKREMLKKAYEKEYGLKDYNVRFDLLGHSMGGLVSRYFLSYGSQDLPADGSLPKLDWRGAANIDRAILVGTPNAGYLDTCIELTNGLTYAHGAKPYPPGVIGTFHTYYQMMPHSAYRSVRTEDDPDAEVLDMFDIEVWKKHKWGLLAEDQDIILQKLLPNARTREERYAIALDHLAKCLKRAKQFSRAMSRYSVTPPGLSLQLFLGDSVRTSSEATLDGSSGKLKISRFDTGDGKVLASSARGDLRSYGKLWRPFEVSPIVWNGVVHLPGAHMGIIQNAIFRDNVIYYLLSSPDRYQREEVKKLLKKLD